MKLSENNAHFRIIFPMLDAKLSTGVLKKIKHLSFPDHNISTNARSVEQSSWWGVVGRNQCFTSVCSVVLGLIVPAAILSNISGVINPIGDCVVQFSPSKPYFTTRGFRFFCCFAHKEQVGEGHN